MSANQSRILVLIVAIVVACVGGLIRVVIAQQDWLWLDELHTAWTIGGTFLEVSNRAEQGNQSPLFFWLVWPVVQLLGKKALALRLVPLITGVAVILCASLLTWKWTRSVIATFVVGWLIAIDPWFVFYGTEARPYGLLQLLSVIQVILFWRVLATFCAPSANDAEIARDPLLLRSGIWLAVFSAAMLYCHYTCVWLFVAEVIFFIGYCGVLKIKTGRSFHAGRASLAFLLIAAAVAVICLPAIFHLLEVYDRRGNWALVSSRRNLLVELRWPVLLRVLLPLICAAIFFLPNKEKHDFERFDLQPTERNIVKILFVLLWAFVPIAAVLLLDHYRVAPLALYRYTLVGAVAIPLFAGFCVALPSKWNGQLAIAVIVVGASFYQNPFSHQLVATRTLPRLRFENWDDPIREINARDDKQTHPVFLFSNLIEDVHAFATADREFHEYLLFPINGVTLVDTQHRKTMAAPTMLSQHFRPTDIELMKQQGGAWLLIRGDQALVTMISNELRALLKQLEEATSISENSQTKKPNQDAEDSREQESVNEPEIQFAQFPLSNVYLVSIDW